MKNFYFTVLFLVVRVFAFGQSTEVGVTEGELSVSLLGAAGYNIPILVPPGINGIVPQINLAYNSQAGNGIVGYGWNIAGISTISRIPATKFHDGIIDPVDFNTLDRFAFDGQRLVVKNGTEGIYGANGTTYETESFSNVKITSYGVHPMGLNYGPAYFLVEYPDGSKGYYGNSSDSRSITNWSITYWENPQGVRISYSYLSSYNTINIESINYGATHTAPPINQIKFLYKQKKRLEQSFVGGQSIMSNIILDRIEVSGNNVGFRNYVLAHIETSLGYQRLKSITEKNGDNSKSYNPTSFEYDSESNDDAFKVKNAGTIDISGVDYTNTEYVSGDFDGDGQLDLILYPKTGDNKKKEYRLFTNIASDLNSSNKQSVGDFEEIFPLTWLNSDNKLLARQAWAVVKTNSFATYVKGATGVYMDNEKQYTFPKFTRNYIYPCGGTEPLLKSTETNSRKSNLTANSSPYKDGSVEKDIDKIYINGDFNGDGLTDIVVIEKPLTYYIHSNCIATTEQKYKGGKSYFVNLDVRISSNFVNQSGFLDISEESKVIVADFDGDGKSDIYVFDKGKVSVYILNSDNQFNLLFTQSDTGIVLDRQILMGDFNGDVKTDFFIPNALNQDSWNFYLATGTTFSKVNGAIGVEYKLNEVGYYGVVGEDGVARFPYCLNENSYIANDYNGDGKTDILYQQNLTVAKNGNTPNVGAPQVTKLVLLENQIVAANIGVHFSSINTNRQITGVGKNPLTIFTNHNQLNQNLEYSLISGNTIKSFNSPKDTRNDVLIRKIINGNKVEEAISYESLNNKVYSGSPNIEKYPNFDVLIAPSFQVVSKLEKKSATVFKKQLFSYYGAVSNVEGLGFLGFRSTVKTNWHDRDDAIISTITRNDINLRGANVENYSVLGWHDPLRSSETSINSKIIKEGNYLVEGNENLVATQSITLKPNTWIKPGSTFSAKINEEANNASNTPIEYITKTLSNYESELLSNKVFKLKNTTTKQYNGLDNTSSEINVEYDEINNPLKSTTLLKEGTTTVQTTISEVEYNKATLSPYVIGRPKSKKQSVMVVGDIMTSEELYFYENSLLTQIQKKGTNTDYIFEDNKYDVFGNIIQKTISASGIPARVTNYGYDPSGRFLIRSTDIERLSTVYEYDLNNGLLISERNPYGLTTSYLYDSWFKKTIITDYLKNRSMYTYTRNGSFIDVKLNPAGGGESIETFDDLGRKIKEGKRSIGGSFSYVDYEYDIHNRNHKVSEAHFNAARQWNETKYDVYGRVVQNISFTGKITDIDYPKQTTKTIVNDGTKSKISVKNAMGNVVSMTDFPGGTINYTYFANGNLKESDYGGVKTTIKQDGWGRKTELNDPSAGIYKYDYNAFGEIINETTPNGTTAYILDPAVGKVMQKTIKGTNTDSKTIYTYDNSSKLLVEIEFKDSKDGKVKTTTNSFTYDDSKRIIKTVETTPYAEFIKEINYDGFGRINTETSTAKADGKSSSKAVKNTYMNGLHWQLLDAATNKILWQTKATNGRWQLTDAQAGPITITNLYDAYGLASQFKYDRTSDLVNILTLNTVFDAKRGNLTSRTNSLFDRNENFKYDLQDRLSEFTNIEDVQEGQMYDDQGRITQNNLGSYGYAKDKPYQNNSIEVTPEALNYYTAKPIQIISYNTFKSPVVIDEKDIDKISFEYNDSNKRTAMFYGGLQEEKLERPLHKYYSADGTMEIKQNIVTGAFEFITYIGGDGYSAPIVFKTNNTTQEYLYLLRDYQGSILSITNQTGDVVEKRLFDAWGAIVSVQDSVGNNLAGLTILDRGYTGHEHLQSVGLINMNGRIYDPRLHRFLQPDNFVQDPFNTQNYNRYGYCWNNPLVYTDPSGEIIPLVIIGIIVVSAAINVYQNWDNITGGTGKFSDIHWDKFAGFTVSGAASGALTVYGGPYGVVIGAGVQAFMNSAINGDDMRTTLINTGSAAAAGFVTRGIGLQFDATFANGLIGGNNIFNSVITGAAREVVFNFSGSITNDLISSGFADPAESFRKSLDPVNLGLSAFGGSLTGLNGFASQPSYIPKTSSPIMNSFELRTLIPFYVNPSFIIPKYIIPTRNVIPATFKIPKLKPQFKG